MKNLIYLALTLSHLSAQAESLAHENLRWGLHNQGQIIQIDLNPLQSYRLQGIPGEDIHLAPVSSATKFKKIKVAILDTGIDYSHPELAPLIYRNEKQCLTLQKLKSCLQTKGEAGAASCRSDILVADANTYPGDCQGWSVINKDVANTPNNIIGRPDFTDTIGHGTHVAGIIASVTRNIEIIPVQVITDAPNQPIKPFSIDLSPSEEVRNGFVDENNLSERIARGIIYAMNAGAQVINLSLGWPEAQDSDIMKEAIIEAQSRGIIIVAAAGNDSTTSLLLPCHYKGVICVAAHRPDGAISSFSNFGYAVDIAAPGSEILSTIPMNHRSIRLAGFKGYDYLSGTSQAAPYVTGAVADMLSRGIPAAEIYPRLILGARKIKPENNVIQGPVNSQGLSVKSKSAYIKNLLSGLLDVQGSLNVTEQSLILPADKEIQVIAWDRKALDLNFEVKLKNFWKPLSQKQITVEMRPTISDIIYPEVSSVQVLGGLDAWDSQEEKVVQVGLHIRDRQQAYQSRLPSELSYLVTIKIDGKISRQFEIQAEVIVGVVKTMSDPETIKIPLRGTLPQGVSLSLFDEVYDDHQAARDYLLVGADQKNKNAVQLGLSQFINGTYVIGSVQSFKFDGTFDNSVLQQKIRIDLDHSGRSHYMIRFIEYPDISSKAFRVGAYVDHFYIFDEQMNLTKYLKFSDPRALIPFKFQWINAGNNLRPAWVGRGQEVRTRWDVSDLWTRKGSEDVKTPSDIHFYYLNEKFELQQVASPADFRIVDFIQTTLQQVKDGIVSVLLAKNLGTDFKPSYLNSFYLGQITEGQLQIQNPFDGVSSTLNYRNLVDTYKDSSFNLTSSANEFRGTMWYGLDAHQQQRVTLMDGMQTRLLDKMLGSQRPVFDNALMIRAGFQSSTRAGVFLITNSEIEYHDLKSNQVASRSLNRYSFYGESAFVELQFPITLVDSQTKYEKLPALLKTEGSGLNRGHKIVAPVITSAGLDPVIISPAKLRLKTEKGCRALEAPVFLGQDSGYAMDYYCGDQILRIQLKY